MTLDLMSCFNNVQSGAIHLLGLDQLHDWKRCKWPRAAPEESGAAISNALFNDCKKMSRNNPTSSTLRLSLSRLGGSQCLQSPRIILGGTAHLLTVVGHEQFDRLVGDLQPDASAAISAV